MAYYLKIEVYDDDGIVGTDEVEFPEWQRASAVEAWYRLLDTEAWQETRRMGTEI